MQNSYGENFMQALICDNLVERIDFFFGGAEGHKTNKEFLKLADRITGKNVDLVFIGRDAFEKKDNNYWLPNCCWTEIK